MLYIKELGVCLSVDDDKNFIGKKDEEPTFKIIDSINREEVRKELQSLSLSLKKDRKIYNHICKNEGCKKPFTSFRRDAKWCGNSCRQAVKNKKAKIEKNQN